MPPLIQVRPHEEFRRQIVGDLLLDIEIGLASVNPPMLHTVAYRQRKRAVIIVRPGERDEEAH